MLEVLSPPQGLEVQVRCYWLRFSHTECGFKFHGFLFCGIFCIWIQSLLVSNSVVSKSVVSCSLVSFSSGIKVFWIQILWYQNLRYHILWIQNLWIQILWFQNLWFLHQCTVILHIENKCAPLRGLKMINLPQNCKKRAKCQNLRVSFKIMLNIGKILTFVSKKHQK